MRLIRHDLAANKGRHFKTSPTARNIFTPASRTGSPSGSFVGTGVNRKTASRPEYQARQAAPSTNYTRQAQQFVRSAPEPFRNSTRAANPRGTMPRDDGHPFGGASPSLTPGDWRRAQPTRQPHSQEEINRASGHAASYSPAGQDQVVGVRRRQPRAGQINLPGNGPQTFKTNTDPGSPFSRESMAQYARLSGGRAGEL